LALRYAVLVVSVRAPSLWGKGHRVVQQGSTATGADGSGSACTLWDGEAYTVAERAVWLFLEYRAVTIGVVRGVIDASPRPWGGASVLGVARSID
jgi:hypothetical protein